MQLRRWKKRRTQTTPRMVVVRQMIVGVAVIVGVTAFGYLVWYATRVDTLTIQSVSVSGGETILHDNVATVAEEVLNGSYFKLVPHRFAWTYPKEDIEQALLAEDRVKEVKVDRDSGTELAVTVTEYEPIALWCAYDDETACLFLDNEGYAFSVAPPLTGSSFLRYSDPMRLPTLGEIAFDDKTSMLFLEFADAVEKEYDFSVTRIVQMTPEEVVYHLANGGQLKVSAEAELDDVLKNLDTILTSNEFNHLKTDGFNYVDLRYGDRVFVNEEDPHEGSEEESTIENSATSTDVAEQ